ncbi:MAG: hypothetical protein R3300_03210 [Candidatus Promineifilaceae bacterium]|nr:hypothetical protein [Candidatus Promineifilaceae bacterium]
MSTHVIFFGWNRPVPGREQQAGDHFQEFIQYLSGLQQSGAIDSFEPVLLSLHGGDLNGFFLIRGTRQQLVDLEGTDDWLAHSTRAGLHSSGVGVVQGVTGEGVMQWMELWQGLISA